jgi:hypothetical protein
MPYDPQQALTEFRQRFIEEDHDIDGINDETTLVVTGNPYEMLAWVQDRLRKAYFHGRQNAPSADDLIVAERERVAKIARRYAREYGNELHADEAAY